MVDKLVINTSSSLFFVKIGLIPLLLNTFKLITSKEVHEELKEGEEIGYKDAKLIMQYITDTRIEVFKAKKTKEIAKEYNIKTADASVIALAKELNCFMATEDKQIEKICLITQTKATNTAILIYFLWQKKKLSNDQTFLLLDLLVRNGYNKEACLKIKEKLIKGDKNV